MRHKHADLIHAWAEGAEIECAGISSGVWYPSTNPNWAESSEYRIKPKEPEWFESIPEQGVLCWVSDTFDSPDKDSRIDIIVHRRSRDTYISHKGCCWVYAIPLTNTEIQQFLK